MTAADWAAKIRAGDLRSLARAASAVENGTPAAADLLRELPRNRALVVGITGPPGAGKSTLANHLCALLRAAGRRVAILAADPSSPVSGGAILGDRIRMADHHGDPGVFIRSMASRGELGGLAKTTAAMVRLMEGAGFDAVLVETVGVGQAEVAVAGVAGVVVVVLAPGMGDDIQAIKAGILEVADIFAVNKADREGAGALAQELHAERSHTPVIKTVASEGTGVAELLDAIEKHPRRDRAASIESPAFSIDHLGVAVGSLDAALEFWREQLGMTLTLRERVETERVDVAMLDASGPRIELLESADPESAIGKFLAKRGPGIHHVALRVKDFTGTIDRLRACGARLLGEPRTGAGGHTYVFVHPSSTGGVLLELIEEKES
jgi:LAO/AO transport system kinase